MPSRESAKRVAALKKARQKQPARSKTATTPATSTTSTTAATKSRQAVDTSSDRPSTEPTALRRSTRSHASKTTNPPATQNTTKKKPGYIYVPIGSDDEPPFDLPVRTRGSRARHNSRVASKVPDEVTREEVRDPPSTQPVDEGLSSCSLPDSAATGDYTAVGSSEPQVRRDCLIYASLLTFT